VTTARKRILVAGGGWAGLAAAVEATRLGHAVTLLEMAPQLGGRARTVDVGGDSLDNGQHIAIGAYVETLRLMNLVGVRETDAFDRRPLELRDANGPGLRLASGSPAAAFALAVLRHPRWTRGDKAALLLTAFAWRRAGFRCDAACTVERLAARLPDSVRRDLVEPLCVAALNTRTNEASAAMFLRVLGDALFGGRGHADLLLPRRPLGALIPEPARLWLQARGADVRCRVRVEGLERVERGWRVHGSDIRDVDTVVLATSASEAARIVDPHAPAWAATARALPYEPIVTVYLRRSGARLPAPMLALRDGPNAPAQFVFDRGQLGGPDGLLAFVVSGASRWLEAGLEATLDATRRQAASALGTGPFFQTVQVIAERRATLKCVPGLLRPAASIAPGLMAAGDHVDGPYPSTLEGAVRSGFAAARGA